VCLPFFVQSPLRIAPLAVGQPFGQALDPMPPEPLSHGCAGAEGTYDQGYVVVAQSQSVVTHGAYGTIVPKGGQQGS